MRHFWRMLILVLCLQGLSLAEETIPNEPWPGPETAALDPYLQAFERIDILGRNFDRTVKETYAVQLVPHLVEVRANYWRKSRAGGSGYALDQTSPDAWGSYVDLLAKFSPLAGRLVGESEIAYSALGFSEDEIPFMTRFGLNGKWDRAGYGLLYRTFTRGFVPLAGAKIEQDRDECQVWGEYDFTLFRLRGAAGQTWERDGAADHWNSTRNATTSFHIDKPTWSALLSSTYSTIDRNDSAAERSLAFANALALVYRPVSLLTLEPHLGFKQEWRPGAGLKTDTPSAGFALAYTPTRDIQLAGRALFSRSVAQDPQENASVVDTTAGLNWKLGRTSLGDPSVSLQFSYKNESRAALPEQDRSQVLGMVQFKLAGF